ncbi:MULTISPECIES: response regulator [Pseudomonadaceae]|uniref:response regulator n=1 Tax=Pseudomonadaceae TaxID=135621 RepID=UPI00040D4455|nr:MULTISPECIES: response regulator [Pseudomonas]KIZ49288.1 chemotaxis protein CheY [Pseudomonas oryzihabitans]MBH3331300.1 response regulator transcription factor [Pseudomonas oryzihabitans]MDU4055407.1 response regulator [Pseudomonas oryzihabitans]NMZ43756.1 response regulator transcription factor [Pseudomonas oryzihabitans]NMZ63617.1 response regulator transcription factor [Pseudomonas oryzihabitans]
MGDKLILIVEDDADSASVLEAYLLRDGFAVVLAEDGRQGLELFQRERPDLVLLDMMLPRLGGTEVLAQIRRAGDTPVIMVTAIGDEPEKLGALRYGADDYVVKPYNPKEVVARVHAVLRRCHQAPRDDRWLRHGALTVDLERFSATVEARALELTPTEFGLLATLMRTPHKAFTREELLERCLPESEALARVVDTHLHNLRRKLEAAGLPGVPVTVRAIGYRFS